MLIKKLFLIAASVAVFTGCAMAPAGGGASDQASVAAAAERLRIAMVDPTAAALGALVADDLSYGHSGGKVDTKASFISDLLDGKSDFVTITITEQAENRAAEAATRKSFLRNMASCLRCCDEGRFVRRVLAYCGPSESISALSCSISAGFRSVSGARTGPASWPTIFAPAFTMLTA